MSLNPQDLSPTATLRHFGYFKFTTRYTKHLPRHFDKCLLRFGSAENKSDCDLQYFGLFILILFDYDTKTNIGFKSTCLPSSM